MKRIFGFISICLMAVFLFCSVLDAKEITGYQLLNDAAGTPISSYELTSLTAVYSENLRISDTNELKTLLIVEDKAGGAGDVDISAEYSVDGVTFYPAYTSDMSGALTLVGLISLALGDESRWIVWTPRIGIFLRYKFDPDADSQITAYHIRQVNN